MRVVRPFTNAFGSVGFVSGIFKVDRALLVDVVAVVAGVILVDGVHVVFTNGIFIGLIVVEFIDSAVAFLAVTLGLCPTANPGGGR